MAECFWLSENLPPRNYIKTGNAQNTQWLNKPLPSKIWGPLGLIAYRTAGIGGYVFIKRFSILHTKTHHLTGWLKERDRLA